jgi:hypothetical protein
MDYLQPVLVCLCSDYQKLVIIYLNVNNSTVIQVVPQLDNGPKDEGARLVLKKKSVLEGSPGPFNLLPYREEFSG